MPGESYQPAVSEGIVREWREGKVRGGGGGGGGESMGMEVNYAPL